MLWNLYQQKLNQTFISQIWESLLSLIVTLDNGIRWCWDDQFATTNTNTSHPLLSQASFLINFCKTRWKVCYTVFLEFERTFPVTKKKISIQLIILYPVSRFQHSYVLISEILRGCNHCLLGFNQYKPRLRFTNAEALAKLSLIIGLKLICY